MVYYNQPVTSPSCQIKTMTPDKEENQPYAIWLAALLVLSFSRCSRMRSPCFTRMTKLLACFNCLFHRLPSRVGPTLFNVAVQHRQGRKHKIDAQTRTGDTRFKTECAAHYPLTALCSDSVSGNDTLSESLTGSLQWNSGYCFFQVSELTTQQCENIAVFTAILIARHCFSLKDFLQVALISLTLVVKNGQ